MKLSQLPRLLLHVPVPWVFVLGYFLGVGLEKIVFPHKQLSAATAHAIWICGAVVFLVGAIIAGWGLILFHRARTTTTPGKASKTLVMQGPYRFTRNPMYVGLTLAYLGEMGLLVQIAPLIPLLLVIAYVQWTVIPVEEKKLCEVFGDEYVQYQSRVPRWL